MQLSCISLATLLYLSCNSLAYVHDENAIKILGCYKGALGMIARKMLGFVPAELAARLVKSGMVETVKPRLTRVYESDNGYVDLHIDIIGPSDKYGVYKPPSPGELLEAKIRTLKKEERYDEVIPILLDLVKETEEAARMKSGYLNSTPYFHLATIYRKQNKIKDEIEILERFLRQPKAADAPTTLALRLVKARELLGNK